jgi:1,2-phenylacetyl-CoA epoxidase catalytic subunit
VEHVRVTDDAFDAASGEGERERDPIFRYYELAKRAEWQVRDLPWDDQPPIPETRGSREKQARRRDIWRSVITQQLQADAFAVEMAAQLFQLAPHHDAKLYYSTMVQDESRHTEAWLRLAEDTGGTGERDPHLDRLAEMFLDLDTLEEKVFLMQVFFERLIIPRFRMIASASRGTVLEDLCNRLTVDDGIHHRSGVAYERVLLADASTRQKQQLIKVTNQMMPIFVEHAMWRPKARAFIGALMQKRDVEMLRGDLEAGVRLASSLGLDVRAIQLPAFD